MNKFSCLILLFIHAYNAGISRHQSYTWLRSYVWLRLVDLTSVIYPNSGHTFWLRSTSRLWSYLLTPITHHSSGRWANRMSYHLSCERFRMVGLDDYNILQPGHLVRSRLGGMHDSFSVQNISISRLCMFECQAMCCTTNGHLARLDLRETRVSRRTRCDVPPLSRDGQS
jgi:hypothetical protein